MTDHTASILQGTHSNVSMCYILIRYWPTVNHTPFREHSYQSDYTALISSSVGRHTPCTYLTSSSVGRHTPCTYLTSSSVGRHTPCTYLTSSSVGRHTPCTYLTSSSVGRHTPCTYLSTLHTHSLTHFLVPLSRNSTTIVRGWITVLASVITNISSCLSTLSLSSFSMGLHGESCQ